MNLQGQAHKRSGGKNSVSVVWKRKIMPANRLMNKQTLRNVRQSANRNTQKEKLWITCS